MFHIEMDKKKFLDGFSKMTREEQEQKAKEMKALGDMKLRQQRREDIKMLKQKLEQKQDDINLILEALNEITAAEKKKGRKRFVKKRVKLTKRILAGKLPGDPLQQKSSLSLYLGQPNVW